MKVREIANKVELLQTIEIWQDGVQIFEGGPLLLKGNTSLLDLTVQRLSTTLRPTQVSFIINVK